MFTSLGACARVPFPRGGCKPARALHVTEQGGRGGVKCGLAFGVGYLYGFGISVRFWSCFVCGLGAASVHPSSVFRVGAEVRFAPSGTTVFAMLAIGPSAVHPLLYYLLVLATGPLAVRPPLSNSPLGRPWVQVQWHRQQQTRGNSIPQRGALS